MYGRTIAGMAALGAMKGMSDLFYVRNPQYQLEQRDHERATNMYLDKVTPPPTYLHAAADQGVVGFLGGLGIAGAMGVKKRHDDLVADWRAAGRNPAGRRGRASSNVYFERDNEPRVYTGLQTRRASSSA